jgi:glucose-6-phosphate dehydrogenase assembly protein OpcA
MATRYKVLGQVAPAETTNTTLYEVPTLTEAVASSLVIANRAAIDATYRVAVRPAGATLANEHYIAYDVTVGASDSTVFTIGMALAATDVVTVYASTADLSFTIFGSSIDL